MRSRNKLGRYLASQSIIAKLPKAKSPIRTQAAGKAKVPAGHKMREAMKTVHATS